MTSGLALPARASFARRLGVWTLGSLVCLPACSGTDETSVPAPGIRAEQCPGAPVNPALHAVAPFWNGLYTVDMSVPGGAPDFIELSLLEPGLNAWQSHGNDFWEASDGRFVVAFQPQGDARTAGAELQARVRARSAGCAPSGWVPAGSLQPGDPLADTSWRGSFDPAELTGSLSTNRVDPIGGAPLPATTPGFSAAVEHTVSFHADGSLAEEFVLPLSSAGASEPFAGCRLDIHYVGTWSWGASAGGSNGVLLSRRVPAADALAGSECAFPALDELLLGDASAAASLAISPAVWSPNVDYRGLLDEPPGPVWLEGSQLAAELAQVLAQLSYTSEGESGSIVGYATPLLGVYQKQ